MRTSSRVWLLVVALIAALLGTIALAWHRMTAIPAATDLIDRANERALSLGGYDYTSEIRSLDPADRGTVLRSKGTAALKDGRLSYWVETTMIGTKPESDYYGDERGTWSRYHERTCWAYNYEGPYPVSEFAIQQSMVPPLGDATVRRSESGITLDGIRADGRRVTYELDESGRVLSYKYRTDTRLGTVDVAVTLVGEHATQPDIPLPEPTCT